MNKEQIQLSVVDIERKYTIDPAESVYGGGDGIVSWGIDNNLPSLMTTCYEKSTTLGTVIDQTVNYVTGDGIEISEDAAKWREKVNRRGMTPDAFIEHITYDFITYGNVAIQVVFNKLGLPCELFPLDVTRCRLTGDGKRVLYSKKAWTKYQTKGESYDRFGYNDFDPEKPTQIFFYNGSGIRKNYNRAPWFSSLQDVLVEIESGVYSLNAVSNGFAARYVFNFPQGANKTDEQKKAISDGIKEKFCGPDAESLFLLYWNDGEQGLDVKKIEADETPERFIAIRNNSKDNIYAALRMNPLLCGMAAANTGFSTQEFSDSYRLYDRTVAHPFRQTIEGILNAVTMTDNAFKIKPFTITFDNAE